jgi:hypothetical protein
MFPSTVHCLYKIYYAKLRISLLVLVSNLLVVPMLVQAEPNQALQKIQKVAKTQSIEAGRVVVNDLNQLLQQSMLDSSLHRANVWHL